MKKNARNIVRNRPMRGFPAAAPEQSATEIAHIVKPLIESATPAAAPAAKFPKSKKEIEDTELAHVSR